MFFWPLLGSRPLWSLCRTDRSTPCCSTGRTARGTGNALQGHSLCRGLLRYVFLFSRHVGYLTELCLVCKRSVRSITVTLVHVRSCLLSIDSEWECMWAHLWEEMIAITLVVFCEQANKSPVEFFPSEFRGLNTTWASTSKRSDVHISLAWPFCFQTLLEQVVSVYIFWLYGVSRNFCNFVSCSFVASLPSCLTVPHSALSAHAQAPFPSLQEAAVIPSHFLLTGAVPDSLH